MVLRSGCSGCVLLASGSGGRALPPDRPTKRTLSQAASRFLGTVLDGAATLIVLTSALAVALSIGTMNPGLAGVVIAQSLQLTGIFQFSVRQSTEVRTRATHHQHFRARLTLLGRHWQVENFMTSVERVGAYGDISTEAARKTPATATLPKPWPAGGAVEFRDVTMRWGSCCRGTQRNPWALPTVTLSHYGALVQRDAVAQVCGRREAGPSKSHVLPQATGEGGPCWADWSCKHALPPAHAPTGPSSLTCRLTDTTVHLARENLHATGQEQRRHRSVPHRRA